MAVSTPSHPSYGHHLSLSDITSLVAPTHSTLNTVRAWLVGEGVPPMNIQVTLTLTLTLTLTTPRGRRRSRGARRCRQP